jgi:hypothetical protein
MTEEEWLESKNPRAMLFFLRNRKSSRKLRLYVCACVRRVWEKMADRQGRLAVEVAERYAEGKAKKAELSRVHEETKAELLVVVRDDPDNVAVHFAGSAAYIATKSRLSFGQAGTASYEANVAAENHDCPAQAGLLRCVFGNPFRPITLDPSWITPAVRQLAAAAYEERILPSGQLDPHRLAVLADALEEAGASGDILSHLRGPGLHVRGCFAVDLALGRE